MSKAPTKSSTGTRKSTTPAAPKLRRVPKPAAKTAAVASRASKEPTVADIARRAYEIFLGRAGTSGDAVSDWLQAEQELRSSLTGPR